MIHINTVSTAVTARPIIKADPYGTHMEVARTPAQRFSI